MSSYDAIEHDQPCWSCGTLNEAITEVTAEKTSMPEAGDVHICFSCGALGLFTGNRFEARAPTPAERELLLADEKVQAVLGYTLTHIATKEHP